MFGFNLLHAQFKFLTYNSTLVNCVSLCIIAYILNELIAFLFPCSLLNYQKIVSLNNRVIVFKLFQKYFA